jgi:hypothetical protein
MALQDHVRPTLDAHDTLLRDLWAKEKAKEPDAGNGDPGDNPGGGRQ